MFKIAFPWAHEEQEKTERNYLKSLEFTSHDETAGNVWITPEFGMSVGNCVWQMLTLHPALELAKEYGLDAWIRALLDSAEISEGSSSGKESISPPPKFDLSSSEKTKLAPPSSKAPRSRAVRSSSPSKTSTPARAKASPRKRQTKAQKEANIANANAASATLQSALDDAASVVEADGKLDSPEVEDASVDDEAVANGEVVKVEVDQSVEVDGTTETTHTNVTVEMPAGSPDLPMPEDTEQMLETAKRMVEEARALEGSPRISRKRKAPEPESSDIDADLPIQPTKKARILEEKLKREKVRTRAVLGMTATLAIA
jgi:hypothetical protein